MGSGVMSREALAKALTGIYELHGRKPTPDTFRVWCAAMDLVRIDYGKAAEALIAHSVNPDNGKYLPKPADIVAICHGSRQSLEDQAALQFSKVREAIRWPGSTSNVVFDDPRTMQVVGQWGWTWTCENYSADVDGVWASNFRRDYIACDGHSFPKMCLGRYTDNPTKLLGDEAKCQAIMRDGLPPAESRQVRELAAPVGETVKALGVGS